MIIYNVTVKIDNEVHNDWVSWMKNVHIPEVMNTGFFLENRFAKILVDDEDGVNYSIQYKCANAEDLKEYQNLHAPKLQAKHTEMFRNKFVAFRTLLEIVDES